MRLYFPVVCVSYVSFGIFHLFSLGLEERLLMIHHMHGYCPWLSMSHTYSQHPRHVHGTPDADDDTLVTKWSYIYTILQMILSYTLFSNSYMMYQSHCFSSALLLCLATIMVTLLVPRAAAVTNVYVVSNKDEALK